MKLKTLYIKTKCTEKEIKDKNLLKSIYRNMVKEVSKELISNGFLMRKRRLSYSDDIELVLVVNAYQRSDFDFPLEGL